MSAGLLRRVAPWLALPVLACATQAADMSRPVSLGAASTNLNGALTGLAVELGLRLVCVLPETPGVGASAGPSNTPGVTAAPAWEVLETLCARHRMNWWVERDTLMLRPVVEEGKRWRNAPAQGAMALLSSLTPDQLAVIYRGDLLPLSGLSVRQTEALVAAQANACFRGEWDSIFGRYTNQCAFGIFFDPYVSATTSIGVRPRYFYARGAVSARLRVAPTGEDGVIRAVGSAVADAPPIGAAAPIGGALEIKGTTVFQADELLRRLSVIAGRALNVNLDERRILLGPGTYAAEPLVSALGHIATTFGEDRKGREMASATVERPRVGGVFAQFLPASPDILAGILDLLTPVAHAASGFTDHVPFATDAFLEGRTISVGELSSRQMDWIRQVAPATTNAPAIRLGLGYLAMVARYGDAETNGTRRVETAVVIQIAWDFPVYTDGWPEAVLPHEKGGR